MKKTYTSPLLQQHKYVQELDAAAQSIGTSDYRADNEIAFDNDAWA